MWDDSLTYVTPVYNGSSFVHEVITSVSSQVSAAGLRYRHVIVDDGSTDDTWEELERARLESGGRITTIQKPNGGEASAVNRAMDDVVTPYVCVVNADDPLLEGHGNEMSSVLDAAHEVVVAYPDWLMIDSQGGVVLTKHTRPYDIRALVGDFVCLPGPGAVIRRSALDGPMRNERYRFISDFELWVRLASVGPFERVAHVLATWREHDAGATALGAGEQIADELMALAEDDLAGLIGPELERRHGRSAKAHASYYAALQIAAQNPRRARQLLLRSFILKPVPSWGYSTDHRNPVYVLLAIAGRHGHRAINRVGLARRRLLRLNRPGGI